MQSTEEPFCKLIALGRSVEDSNLALLPHLTIKAKRNLVVPDTVMTKETDDMVVVIPELCTIVDVGFDLDKMRLVTIGR